MIAVTVEFLLEPGQADAFLPLMRDNARRSLSAEPGCRQFDICRDPGRPDELFLYELYDDDAAFRAHVASPHYKSFDAAVTGMVAHKAVRIFPEVDQ